MKVHKCIIVSIVCVLCGCAKVEINIEKSYALPLDNISVASGIMVHQKMYWETGSEKTLEKGKKIGTVLGNVKKNEIPLQDFYLTKSSKNSKGEEIYEFDQTVYIKGNGIYRIYQYVDTMTLAQRITLEKHNASIDKDVIEDMPTPHIVYHNMMYCKRDTIASVPSQFHNVGSIKDVLFVANQNFTGSGVQVDDDIYMDDVQNYYMIVKTNGIYSVFENLGYEKSLSS